MVNGGSCAAYFYPESNIANREFLAGSVNNDVFGSCNSCPPGPGCTIPIACNYDETAIEDDGSCDFTSCLFGCMDVNACNFSETAISDDGSCDLETCAGCMDAVACNYVAAATIDDGGCQYGCLLYTSDAADE